VKLLHVVGARPNFPKLAPVFRAARSRGIAQVVVHTGQHYDEMLSDGFFRVLELPTPDVNLGVGSGTHAVQTARIIERIEPVLLEHRPDWTVVYGDVNSTMAAAIVASKLGLRVAHVEAGLRSGDRTMPEELNRLVTDRLADLLLTPSRDADETLAAEGEPRDEICFVGNVMVDSLFHARPRARQTRTRERLDLVDGSHVVVTLHRPSNVDDRGRLKSLIRALRTIARERRVIFPVHPRTRARLEASGIASDGITLTQPLGYLEMIDIVDSAHAVVTDSGGLQEETTALGVPCFTVRDNTERPITIAEGTNQLVRDIDLLPALVNSTMRQAMLRRPDRWDGCAGERVVDALAMRC
jgi:UDP-N-acetylglucosamine 2-epimerase (non-hydrolysing)